MKNKKEQLDDVLKILSPALDKLVDIPSRSHGIVQSIIRLQEARMWLMVTIDSIEKDGDVEGK